MFVGNCGKVTIEKMDEYKIVTIGLTENLLQSENTEGEKDLNFLAWKDALRKTSIKFLTGELHDDSGLGCSIKVDSSMPSSKIMRNARLLVDWIDDIYPFLTENSINVTEIFNENETRVKCFYVSEKLYQLKK